MSYVAADLGQIGAIERDIQQMKQDLDQLDGLLKRAEVGAASIQLVSKQYHTVITATKELSQHLKALRSASQATGNHPSARARARGLHEQAVAQLTRLQHLGHEVQRISTVAARNTNLPVGEGLHERQDPLFEDQPGQKQLTLSIEEEEQRAQDMERLESDIVLVNEMFTTLATYVHDQGDMIDSIEANTEVAYVQIQSGTQQLNTATQHRKSARRKKCICLAIVLLAATILSLAIGLSLRSS